MNKYMVPVIVLLCISLVAGCFYYYRVFNSFDIFPDDVEKMVFKDFSGNEITVSDEETITEFLNLLKHAQLTKNVSIDTRGDGAFNIKINVSQKGKETARIIEIGTDDYKLMCVDYKHLYSLMVAKAQNVTEFLIKIGMDVENTEVPTEE